MIYKIREWSDRYEVNQKNRAWVPGEDRRIGPLPYVRMPVNGHSLTLGFRRLNKIAGPDAPAVLGVFTKLLEIAADNEAELRGYIVESDGKPMTAQDIADTLDWELSVVEKALNVLCHNDLQWITQVDSRESPEFPGISREFPTRSDQIRSGQIRTDQPKTRGRARAASAVSDSADSAGSEAGSSLPAPAGPEPTTRRNTEPASPAPEPARPATITGSAVPEYPQNAPRASCAVSGNPEIQTKTDTNNLTEVISQIQRQPSRDYLNDLFRRIKRVSNDPKHWVDWWKQALPQVVANDRLHAALTEALGYAEDCANPATRQVKGLGPHRAPGAYITSKLLEAARSAGVRLPKLPTREDAA